MCGINGLTGENKAQIQFMNNVIRYRGPDNEGVSCDKNISSGHVPLSMVYLSNAGHQPMSNQDKKIGITYSFHELKEKLLGKGHVEVSNLISSDYYSTTIEYLKIFKNVRTDIRRFIFLKLYRRIYID